MNEPGTRQALTESALHGSPVLHKVEGTGGAYSFTVHLISLLDEYGEIEPGMPAVVALLQEIAARVGSNRQAQIRELIQEYSAQVTGGPVKMAVDKVMLISFLIEIGHWAKNELSERWKLRRKQQEVDLTDRMQIEQTVPGLLQDLVNEKSEREVARILALIERKRDAIDRAQNAKLADREEYDQQRLTRAAFEQREKEHNATIQQMLSEIADDLRNLGLPVERLRT